MSSRKKPDSSAQKNDREEDCAIDVDGTKKGLRKNKKIVEFFFA